MRCYIMLVPQTDEKQEGKRKKVVQKPKSAKKYYWNRDAGNCRACALFWPSTGYYEKNTWKKHR